MPVEGVSMEEIPRAAVQFPGPRDIRITFSHRGAADLLAAHLAHLLLEKAPRKGPLAVLCIGTDRSTGDALGPLVGTALKGLAPRVVAVLGTLDEPVHATNLGSKLGHLAGVGRDPTILAVDASLGKSENVGLLTLGPGPLQPGAGVQKNLPPVGDFHLTGTVNVGGFMEHFILQNTRLSLVMAMAEIMAQGIARGLNRYLVGH